MKKTDFNDGWVFKEGGGCILEILSSGEPKEKAVTLPHDASIERDRLKNAVHLSGTGFYEPVNCHYVKEFFMEEQDQDSVVWLEFEGVYQNAFVYVNNSFVGKCFYGYSNFYLDITQFLHFGKNNRITVVVKNGVASGRWYTGSGIYRKVNLMIADRMHFLPDQVQFSTACLEDDLAVVEAKVTLEYRGCGTKCVQLKITVLDEQGNTVAENRAPVTMMEHTKETVKQRIYISDPMPWDPNHPTLYRYRAELAENGQVLDADEGTFGIRTLAVDPKHGLRLNGKHIKLRGGCIHHDHGILGAATFYAAEERRIKKLKEAGYNCIRSAHHPASRELLHACDRVGMLVVDEFSDVWTVPKVDFDYGMHMTDCWEEDVERMVNTAFNHPSVIIYSVGNEIPETGSGLDSSWGKKIADKIRSMDPGRFTLNSVNLTLSVLDRLAEFAQRVADGREEINMEFELPQEKAEINEFMNNQSELSEMLKTSRFAGEATEEAFSHVDIAGYNYGACRYEKDGTVYPNRVILGSETFSCDLDKNWELVEKLDYLIGDICWTAWDYLGEAGIGRGWYGESDGGGFYAAYPWRAGYCGDFGLTGDRRPVSYWKEIIWGLRRNPYIIVHNPVHYNEEYHTTEWGFTNAIHSWNWSGQEGMPVHVEVYSPGEETELLVNGKTVGRIKTGQNKKAIALFDTIYFPGRIEAVAYSDGKETGRQVLETAEAQVELSVSTERVQLAADGQDIGFIEVSLRDSAGRLNREIKKNIHVTVEGCGVLQGMGSADPVSEESFCGDRAKTYEGKLLIAVRTRQRPGKIKVTVETEGCKRQEIVFESR